MSLAIASPCKRIGAFGRVQDEIRGILTLRKQVLGEGLNPINGSSLGVDIPGKPSLIYTYPNLDKNLLGRPVVRASDDLLSELFEYHRLVIQTIETEATSLAEEIGELRRLIYAVTQMFCDSFREGVKYPGSYLYISSPEVEKLDQIYFHCSRIAREVQMQAELVVLMKALDEDVKWNRNRRIDLPLFILTQEGLEADLLGIETAEELRKKINDELVKMDGVYFKALAA